MSKFRYTPAMLDNMTSRERMRHGSDRQNKLSTSRPAKRTIRPTEYMGTGNLPRMIVSVFPGESRVTYKLILARVNSFIDQNDERPNDELIRRIGYQVIHN